MPLRALVPLLFAPALLVAAACRSPDAITEDGAVDTTVTDALGRTVTFREPPDRVLPLAPNLTEIALAVGAGARIAAVSPSDDIPAVDSLPRFSTFPLDAEAVVALEPDLLLATDQVNSPADVAPFADLGIPAYFFSFAHVADVPAAMRTAGALLGGDPEPAVERFQSLIARVEAYVEGLERPRTLLLVGDDVLYAFGRDSYASEAVRLAGGDNLTDAFGGQAATLSDEWVLERQPEVIVVLAEPYDPASLLDHHPTWADLPAVAEGRVYGLDPDLVSRPGPRLALGIWRLAQLLHPDHVGPGALGR